MAYKHKIFIKKMIDRRRQLEYTNCVDMELVYVILKGRNSWHTLTFLVGKISGSNS